MPQKYLHENFLFFMHRYCGTITSGAPQRRGGGPYVRTFSMISTEHFFLKVDDRRSSGFFFKPAGNRSTVTQFLSTSRFLKNPPEKRGCYLAAVAAGAAVVVAEAGFRSVAGVVWSPTLPAGASGTVTLIGIKRDLPYLSTP
jgi:hypothetical protein